MFLCKEKKTRIYVYLWEWPCFVYVLVSNQYKTIRSELDFELGK